METPKQRQVSHDDDDDDDDDDGDVNDLLPISFVFPLSTSASMAAHVVSKARERDTSTTGFA